MIALVREAGGGDPEEIIRAKAQEVVAWAKGLQWMGPPYDPLVLASLRGIKCRPETKLFSAEAQLTPSDDGQVVLQYNPDRAEGRRNFSICHEIAHTLFSDCYRMVRQRRSDPTRFDPDHEVEQLCQIAAAEFLMPEADFHIDLERTGLSLRSVRPLVDRYGASREAVVRRMVGMGKRACAAVFFSQRLSPSEARVAGRPSLFPSLDLDPTPKMRILYVAVQRDFPVFFPPDKSVPETSCVYSTDGPDIVVGKRETWDLPGFGDWAVEAMGLPVPADADSNVPTIVALVLA